MEFLLEIDKINTLCQNNSQLMEIVKNVKREIPKKKKYQKRIVKEFKLIQKNEFEKVFLHVIEILKMMNGMPHVIRGSAGSSLLCYLLGITNFDPIKENIVLSRFMHKHRHDMPDIDIDVPWFKHKETFQKIYKKWGDKAARISNHNMYSHKSAIRQAIRDEGHRKFVPRNFKLNKIFDEEETQDRVIDNTKKLIGKFRCYSQHCGGVVILEDDIPEDYLLDNKPKQLKLNKDQAEEQGLIKIDVLSSRGLGQLWEIEKKPIEDYPYDEEVYKIFHGGYNIGITFGESPAMRKLFRVHKPKSINDIARLLGLVRPCASKSNAHFNKNKWRSKTAEFRPIVYDDDGTQIIQELLNCTDSEAELYRRAFSKRNEREMLAFNNRIKSHPDRQLIFDNLKFLQHYSFCKSHAYSYALLLYALAYQKKYNPQKFWVSAINNCHSSYRKWVYYAEAMNTGLKLHIGNPPWKIVKDKLLPKNGTCQMKLVVNDKNDFRKHGYWTSGNFMEGMYYKEEGDKVSFKGLIAISRRYVDWSQKKKEGVTFITIGYDFGKYLDLAITGNVGIGRNTVVEGNGYYNNYTVYVEDYRLCGV